MSKIILVCVCLVGLTQLVWSQNSNLSAVPGGRAHGVPGYLDPQTGTFTTKVQAAQSSETPAVTYVERSGTWEIELTITLTTKPASGDIVTCSAEADVYDPNSIYWQENGGTVASVSGGTATCTVSLPYLWWLTSPIPTDELVGIYYEVDLLHVITVGTTSEIVSTRKNQHTYGYLAVPANGATTKINTTVTI